MHRPNHCPIHTESALLNDGTITKIGFVDDVPRRPVRPVRLPHLQIRAMGTLGLLYGMLILALVIGAEVVGLPLELAVGLAAFVAIAQFAFGPWMMDLTLRYAYRVRWESWDTMPEHLQAFARQTCEAEGMRLPRLGIIDDGTPNAFTYGHTPGNARVVITTGLIRLLEPAELESVVAHEIGHAVHWDLLIMTVAQLVPLALYYMARALLSSNSASSDSKNKSGGAAMAAGLVAYALYFVAEYAVLWLSRTREYHADRYAGRVTGQPNELARALVKVAYGLASRPKEEGGDRDRSLEAISALGIFDASRARALVMSAADVDDSHYRAGYEVNVHRVIAAAKWELWNPWAGFYELNGTHPRVARRLQALGAQARDLGQPPWFDFDEAPPESYWDDFANDLGIYVLPFAAAIGGAAVGSALGAITVPSADVSTLVLGFAIGGFGAGSLIKTIFQYPGGPFRDHTVAALLRYIKVSDVRPIPVTLEGRAIGRGVPGLIWSEDVVVQDPTGLIYLDYRQPLRIWEFLFGLLRAKDLQGEAVSVTGWFRRAPTPYIEVRTLTVGGKTRTSWVPRVKLAVAALLLGIGIGMFFLA